jgi:hypothetical protein
MSRYLLSVKIKTFYSTKKQLASLVLVSAVFGISIFLSLMVNRGSASCTAISTTLGTSALTVSTTASGTYHVWSRIMAPDTINNSFYLQIDSGCAVNVGDSSGILPNSWQWVNYQDGNISTTFDVSFAAAGNHNFTLTGREPGVNVDKILLTSDSCVPSGDGSNCQSGGGGVPIVMLTANPTNIASGASSNLSWSSSNATTCSASGGWTGTKSTSGTQSVSPTSTTTYNLTCTGVGGSASDSTVVTVGSSVLGDLNNDGSVNVFDLSTLLSQYGQTGSGNVADINKDGTVNVTDLSILLSHYSA